MTPGGDAREIGADRLAIRLSQASGVPFYRQIVDQLAGLIHSGQLPPDTRLPSFRDLAPRLLVSLITIRRAYADLEAAGLIVRRQGQGTFVASEVEAAARRRALGEARAQLSAAFARARHLGLRGETLRSFVEPLLEEDEAEGPRARPERKGR
jgi:GntR family transcriptional regulator